MCYECLVEPCHSLCPNADDKAIYVCKDCGEGIYYGDRFYGFGDIILCESCVFDKNKIEILRLSGIEALRAGVDYD